MERRVKESIRKEDSREDSKRIKNQGEEGEESAIEKEKRIKKKKRTLRDDLPSIITKHHRDKRHSRK